MRRTLATLAVAWSAWVALESFTVQAVPLPGPWRHDCHKRLACHPESRPVVFP